MKPDTPRAGPMTRYHKRNQADTLAALRKDIAQGVIAPLRERAPA